MSSQPLTAQQVADARPDGWLHVPDALTTRIRTGDFAAGLRLINAIAAAAEEMNHHPDLVLRYAEVDVRLTSHDVGGVTERDLRLAAEVGELAEAAGLRPACEGLATLELALDTPELARVKPFWQAVLRMDDVSPQDLAHRSGDIPLIWFQESGSDEPRQHWHLDVWVDPGQVDDLINRAEEAGGRLVTDEYAPSFWVLADPEGNKVCLCTQQER